MSDGWTAVGKKQPKIDESIIITRPSHSRDNNGGNRKKINETSTSPRHTPISSTPSSSSAATLANRKRKPSTLRSPSSQSSLQPPPPPPPIFATSDFPGMPSSSSSASRAPPSIQSSTSSSSSSRNQSSQQQPQSKLQQPTQIIKTNQQKGNERNPNKPTPTSTPSMFDYIANVINKDEDKDKVKVKNISSSTTSHPSKNVILKRPSTAATAASQPQPTPPLPPPSQLKPKLLPASTAGLSYVKPSFPSASQTSNFLFAPASSETEKDRLKSILSQGLIKVKNVKRKMMLSSLKKRILRERFGRVERMEVAVLENAIVGDVDSNGCMTLTIVNLVTASDELEDDDVYEEIVSDLCDLVTSIINPSKVGEQEQEQEQTAPTTPNFIITIPRNLITTDEDYNKAFLTFTSPSEMMLVQKTLHLKILVGQSLDVYVGGEAVDNDGQGEGKGEDDYFVCVIENLVNIEYIEDDDEYDETVSDAQLIASSVGTVLSVSLPRDDDSGKVEVKYQGSLKDSVRVVKQLNLRVIGGKTLVAKITNFNGNDYINSTITIDEPLTVVKITNLIDTAEDDLTDVEEYEEILTDVTTVVKSCTPLLNIKSVSIPKESEIDFGMVIIEYFKKVDAIFALGELGKKVVAGKVIEACIVNLDDSIDQTTTTTTSLGAGAGAGAGAGTDELKTANAKKEEKKETRIRKRIPGKYAVYKNLPVITLNELAVVEMKMTQKKSTHYDDVNVQSNASETDPESITEAPEVDLSKTPDSDKLELLSMALLKTLDALELRNKTLLKKRPRRYVAGFREVLRGLRSGKCKLVFMANNLDDWEAVDVKVTSILDLALEKEVRVINVLSKRRIGKAVGKSVKVSVVGVENFEGGYEVWKQIGKIL